MQEKDLVGVLLQRLGLLIVSLSGVVAAEVLDCCVEHDVPSETTADLIKRVSRVVSEKAAEISTMGATHVKEATDEKVN